jgi:beta-galactosidase
MFFAAKLIGAMARIATQIIMLDSRNRAAMSRHLFCLLAAFFVSAACARETLPLDAGWAFHLGDVTGAQAPAFNASSWEKVDVPHDWSIAQKVDEHAPALGGGGFFPAGIGWYRRSFVAPMAWRDQRVSVEFDGVYMNAEVWLNGVRLGMHPYGYTTFRYDLTPHLRLGNENVLAVRVDNAQQPNSRWYSGSGIYRHVRLVVTDPVHIAADGVFVHTMSLSPAEAAVRLAVEVANDTDREQHVTVESILLDPNGYDAARTTSTLTAPAHAAATAAATLPVKHPQPWSPANPQRYRAATRITVNGHAVDQAVTPFGIRTIQVSADRGFQVNGEPVKLAGGNLHHDNGPLGAAAFDRAEERRAELLKAAGFNAVRTSHNPPSPAFLDACDRLGLLVLEEAFDGWEKAKTAHDYSVAMREWWQRDIDSMVRRDRNHPSVVLWSIGNEMYERGNSEGLRIARDLTGRIRELDASRPITAGVNGPGRNGDWAKFDPLFATLDVAGYNYELERYQADHQRVPNRVIVVTESYQSETFKNWAIVNDTPYVIGDFVWSAMDYLGEAGIGRVFPPGEPVVKHWEGNQWPWHGAACGDIDLTGWRKPISHYRAIVWNRGEKLYAAVLTPSPNGEPWGISPWTVAPALPSWTWPGQKDRNLSVEVYSRYPKVRLYLDNRLLGEKPTTRAEEFKATFVVPYAPGVLRAIGMDGDRQAETFTLATADAPARIHLQPDRTVIRPDGEDLSFITVELTDAAGRLNPTSDRDVRFSIKGPATIAAIGNADLTTFETYQANPHRTFQGRALLVLRSTHTGGSIKVTASADGLSDSSVTVQSIAR